MKALATYQKLRGGYYTPKLIADFLAHWAIPTASTRVLEPSCGDGIILSASVKALLQRGAPTAAISGLVHGVELDPVEAAKACADVESHLGYSALQTVHTGDFFAYCKHCLDNDERFDAVVGNPPFIRYQTFPEEHRRIAFYLMQSAGLHPNRLTNAWVPFLVASALTLKDHGRIAMVIPAELLQVNYAAELRSFLSHYFSRITLVTFRKLVFGGIQQEVVLLLAERNGTTRTGIRVIELDGIADLAAYDDSEAMLSPLKEMDHSNEKWTMYFLDTEEISLLRSLKDHPGLCPAREVLSVDVGIVTGMNEFFVLSDEQVRARGLTSYAESLVGRSGSLGGLAFSESDWRSMASKQIPAYLLNAPRVPFDRLPEELKRYINEGEEKGFNTGYKCRIRKPWYYVPSVWTPQAFMLRQVHQYPKIVVNDARATCTDTIHRVRVFGGIEPRVVAISALNSLTFACAEVLGRSYGGGVLELEPNEAERLPLPLLRACALDFDEIDALVRAGSIERALDITDRALLEQGLGLSGRDTQRLRGIWHKLRDRRINRKAERRTAPLARLEQEVIPHEAAALCSG